MQNNPKNINLAIYINNIGSLYYEVDKYRNALKEYKKALVIFEKSPAVNIANIKQIKQNIKETKNKIPENKLIKMLRGKKTNDKKN